MAKHVGKLSPEQIKRIKDRYKDGVSARDIAKSFGVPYSRIQSIVYGQKPRD